MNTAMHHCKNGLILFSSPNKNGFTKQLLDRFLDRLPNDIKFETVDIYKTDIKPCIDCKICFKAPCPFNSDSMGDILDKIRTADIVIVATPIYFNSVPSKFKALLDRCQQLFVKKVIQGEKPFPSDRIGILLTTCGSKDKFAQKSMQAMFEMFFSCIQANFIKHICIMDTDNLSEISLNDDDFALESPAKKQS